MIKNKKKFKTKYYWIKKFKNLKNGSIDNTNRTKCGLLEVVEIHNYKELNKTDYFYNPDDE